jgi:hypothetical protein
MALLFMDGFDYYGNGALLTDFGKWDYFPTGGGSNSTVVRTDRSRTGVASLRFEYAGSANNNGAICKPLLPSGGGFVGFAVYQTPSWHTSTSNNLVEIRENTTVHLALAVSGTGMVSIKRGATTLATSTTPFVTNSWVYVEWGFVIHGTTGSYEVRVDGVADPLLTATGVNTQNGGTGLWDRVGWANVGTSGGSGTTGQFIDDVYVADVSGPAPLNTFLGSVKIEALIAQTGNGSNVGLTPSTGTDHGALVDDPVPNITDYNGSATVGAKDTYNLPSPVLTGEVLAVQVNLFASKSDTGGRQVCAVVRHGGADYDGPNMPLSTSFKYVTSVIPRPGGGAWTTADLIALEAGMKVTV